MKVFRNDIILLSSFLALYGLLKVDESFATAQTGSEEEIRCIFDDNFPYFFIITYVVGAHEHPQK